MIFVGNSCSTASDPSVLIFGFVLGPKGAWPLGSGPLLFLGYVSKVMFKFNRL